MLHRQQKVGWQYGLDDKFLGQDGYQWHAGRRGRSALGWRLLSRPVQYEHQPARVYILHGLQKSVTYWRTVCAYLLLQQSCTFA